MTIILGAWAIAVVLTYIMALIGYEIAVLISKFKERNRKK